MHDNDSLPMKRAFEERRNMILFLFINKPSQTDDIGKLYWFACYDFKSFFLTIVEQRLYIKDHINIHGN